MYCAGCREERLGSARWCVACGAKLQPRARELIEAELGHVRFLLAELERWDPARVSRDLRAYLEQRYRKQERVLASALSGEEAVVNEGAVVQAAPVQPPPAPAANEVGAARAGEDAASHAAKGAGVRRVVNEAGVAASTRVGTEGDASRAANGNGAPHGAAAASARAGTEGDASRAANGNGAPHGAAAASARAANEDGAARRSEPSTEDGVVAPIPGAPLVPSFDVPLPPTPEQRILEQASTWSRLWKPFLYESIGWFVGGFLILAGTLFFVAESWEGMTTTLRSLVVFGLTAGYSAGFSAWGRYFLQRDRVVGAGRVLGLIGSAAAPLPALALLPLAGPSPLFWAPLLLWCATAAWLVRAPTAAHEPALQPILQLAMALTTASMALAPFLAPLGALAVWVDAAAVLWLALALEARGAKRGAFSILAPAYLGLLFSIRVHVALAAAGIPVPAAADAPLVAALGLVVVRARPSPARRALDPVALGVVALQVAAVVAGFTAPGPAGFLTSALCTATLWHLGRGEGARARWHYATYALGYVAYQSVGTVVPGPVIRLFHRVKAALGYAAQPFVPPNFAAVYAVPYVVAIGAFAARLARSRHPDPVERERHHTVASVLLNATAAGAAFFSIEAMAGTDLRPGLWAVPPLAITCLVLGLWLKRRLLSWVGSLALLAVPIAMGAVYSVPAGVLTAGLLSAALAVLSWRIPRTPAHGRSAASTALALGAGLAALVPDHNLLSAAGVALGSGAMAVIAIRHQRSWAWAACGALALIATAVATLSVAGPYAPLVTALAAGVLAAWSRRKPLESWGVVAAIGAVAAVLWCHAQEGHGLAGPVPVLAAGWVTCLLAAPATFGWSPVLGAPMLAAALAPQVLDLPRLFPMSPALSMALLGAMALGASAWTAWRGRSPASVAHGLVAIAGSSLLAIQRVNRPGDEWLILFAAAVVALLGARSTWPRLALTWAALVAVSAAIREPRQELFVALAFTALAALDEWPKARALLFGPRPIATVASSSAVLAMVVWRVGLEGADVPLFVPVLLALALAWARTSGRALYLAVPALLAAPWANGALQLSGWAFWLVPLWAVAVVRVAGWSPKALNRLVPSASPDHLSMWALGALFAVTGAHVLMDAGDARPMAFATAAALVLAGGPFLAIRVACAAALALPYPEARLAGVAALIALGFLSLHAPRVAARVAGPLENAEAPLACALAAVSLAAAHWISEGLVSPPEALRGLLLLGGTLWAAALLTGRTWVLGLAAFVTGAGLTRLGLTPAAALATGALGSAALAVLLRSERAQAGAHAFAARVGAGLPGGWSQPLWFAGAASAAASAAILLSVGPEPAAGALLLVGAALLLWTPAAVEAGVASALFGLSAFALAPEPWRAVGGAAAGLALCLAARAFEGKLPQPRILRHAGWIVSAASLLGLHSLEHASTPVAGALAMLSAWATVWRDERLEPFGWAATLAWLHAALFHAGLVLATGTPHAYILPYVGAASALLATAALWLGPRSGRRLVGLVAATLALVEVAAGVALISDQAVREALVAGVGLGALAIASVAVARRDGDEPFAFVAQGALVLGYLVARCHGMGGAFGQRDSLVALVAGAAFGGLYGWASRQPSPVFQRPAMVGAIALPVMGLFAAPWEREPLVCAALLVGLGAHFAALARRPSLRGPLSLLSAVAFNGALLVAWRGTGEGEPQYYVIPAAISALVLLRVFRDQLSEGSLARLRALALTALYGAAAWKPLLFEETWAMLVCALVCVLGVAAGVATRIRSYVYLGTAFLVVTVSANLVRFGLRDHRLGALFLSALGLLVVGFMVLVSAQRAELLKRYERVRQLLQTWE